MNSVYTDVTDVLFLIPDYHLLIHNDTNLLIRICNKSVKVLCVRVTLVTRLRGLFSSFVLMEDDQKGTTNPDPKTAVFRMGRLFFPFPSPHSAIMYCRVYLFCITFIQSITHDLSE